MRETRILDAAAEVFATQGLSATLADVAKHADVGVATVYRWFASKDDLVHGVYSARLAEAEELARVAAAAADPWTGVAAFLERTAVDIAADKGWHELLTGAYTEILGCARTGLVDLVDAAQRRIDQHVAALVGRAKESGQLRADFEPSDLMPLALSAQAAGEAHQRAVGFLLDGLRVARDRPSALPAPTQRDRDSVTLDRMRRAGSRPPLRGRQSPSQLDVIVRTALELLDESGFEAVTLRAVASRIGVRLNTVSWHVKTKARLHDLMADAVLAEIDLDGLPDGWRERVSALAHRYRRALLSHRDGGRLVAGTFGAEPATLAAAETLVAALLDGELPAPAAAWTCWTIIYFTLGLVQEEQGSPGELADQVTRTSQFPSLARVVPHLVDADYESRFRFGLDLILTSATQCPVPLTAAHA
ncbi:TetR family transcriptional regulator [Kutzneria sp. NPDC052558]|uniref:TetR/AcrR family transcriptional regulator n=1 Tax=Kutzneria sp. NPDC052558 TaxID=3364121 RepID=UPI0037C61F17